MKYQCYVCLFLIGSWIPFLGYGQDKLPTDSLAIRELLNESYKMLRIDMVKGEELTARGLRAARKAGFRELEAIALLDMANHRLRHGELNEADSLAELSRSLIVDLRRSSLLPELYLLTSKIAKDRGEYSQAIKHLYMARDAYEQDQDTAGLALCYNRLGLTYSNLGLHEKAIELHSHSLEMNLLRDHQLGISVNFNNIAAAYLNLEQVDSARAYLAKALALKEEMQDVLGVARAQSTLGYAAIKQERYDEAREWLQAAKLTFEKMNSIPDIASVLINESVVFRKLGAFDEATAVIDEALRLLGKTAFPHIRHAAFQEKAVTLKAMGNYAAAYEYMDRAVKLNDSLRPPDLAGKLIENEARLEAEKQRAEIALLSSRDQLSQLKLEASRRRLYWILSMLLGLAVLALLLYRMYRLRTRTHRQLEVIDEAKSRFFANLSHEFRTPLTLILGPLEQLRTEAPASMVPALDRMHRSARHLLSLNDQLMDLARIESGEVKVEVSRGPLAASLRSWAESFAILAAEKNLRYQIHVPEADTEVGFDADKLAKVVYNLLSNAVKYVPEGGEVRFSARLDSRVRIEVSDSGPGIPPEVRAQLFDRFFRMSQHRRAGIQGSGIGLALTRELVELMGGTLTLDTPAEGGNRFLVDLPFLEGGKVTSEQEKEQQEAATVSTVQGKEAGSQQAAAGSEAGKEADPTEEGTTILVVDDHPDIRAFVREQLEGNYQVLEAANGREGLDMALAHLPDIVISDLMMPEMDGLQLCAAMKQEAETSHIPLILLTALNTVESRIEGLESGADAYMPKPFEVRELLAQVGNLVQQRQLLQEKFRQAFEEPADARTSLPTREQEFFDKFEAQVMMYLDSPSLTVEFLGQEMGMSRVQLFRKTKALTGASPSDLIRQIRLRQAAELLRQGGQNISEVMYAVGFDNPSYFAKVFRAAYGCAPSEYGPG